MLKVSGSTSTSNTSSDTRSDPIPLYSELENPKIQLEDAVSFAITIPEKQGYVNRHYFVLPETHIEAVIASILDQPNSFSGLAHARQHDSWGIFAVTPSGSKTWLNKHFTVEDMLYMHSNARFVLELKPRHHQVFLPDKRQLHISFGRRTTVQQLLNAVADRTKNPALADSTKYGLYLLLPAQDQVLSLLETQLGTTPQIKDSQSGINGNTAAQTSNIHKTLRTLRVFKTRIRSKSSTEGEPSQNHRKRTSTSGISSGRIPKSPLASNRSSSTSSPSASPTPKNSKSISSSPASSPAKPKSKLTRQLSTLSSPTLDIPINQKKSILMNPRKILNQYKITPNSILTIAQVNEMDLSRLSAHLKDEPLEFDTFLNLKTLNPSVSIALKRIKNSPKTTSERRQNTISEEYTLLQEYHERMQSEGQSSSQMETVSEFLSLLKEDCSKTYV